MCTTVPHLLCVRQNTQKSYKVRHFITFVLWQGHNGLEPCQVGKPSYRQVSWNLCIFTSSLPCWEYSVYHCPSSMWFGYRNSGPHASEAAPMGLFRCPVLLSIYSLVHTLPRACPHWGNEYYSQRPGQSQTYVLLLVWVWSPYISLAVLELTLQVRLAMNLTGLSYFCLPSA